jgi:hypothetical protein
MNGKLFHMSNKIIGSVQTVGQSLLGPLDVMLGHLQLLPAEANGLNLVRQFPNLLGSTEYIPGRHNGPFAVLVNEIDHSINIVIEEHFSESLNETLR